MDLKEMAKVFIEYCGLSTIPVSANKVPAVQKGVDWHKAASMSDPSLTQFENKWATGIGLLTGKENCIEVIDIDSKYQHPGQDLLEDFNKVVNESDPNLLSKLVLQKTMNGGYHYIYRYPEDKIEKNQKLASRETTAEEKEKNPHEKVKVLVETRGLGGYIVAAPTEGYKLLKNDFQTIPKLSEEERDLLFCSARSLNEVAVKAVEHHHQTDNGGKSVIDDYNDRADTKSLLERHGWKFVKQDLDNNYYQRPGDTKNKCSACYNDSIRVFYVFTSSSVFEPQKGYNAFGVYCELEHSGDVKAAVKTLAGDGYGDQSAYKNFPVRATNTYNNQPPPQQRTKIKYEENVVGAKDEKEIMELVRSGGWKKGLKTGFENFDKYYRFKQGELTVVVGQPGVGKTTFLIFLATANALLHGCKWTLMCNENETPFIRDTIMSFYIGKDSKDMTKEEYEEAYNFAYKHFDILQNTKLYTHTDFVEILEQAIEKGIDNVLLDPFNSLATDPKILRENANNFHEYCYFFIQQCLSKIKNTKTGLWINCHPNTEAQRQYSADGIQKAPHPSQAEGGGKWVSRADTIMVIHREPKNPDRRTITTVDVHKVRTQQRGGSTMCKDDIAEFKMLGGRNFYGFYENGDDNPIAKSKGAILAKSLGNAKDKDFTPEEQEMEFKEKSKKKEEDWNDIAKNHNDGVYDDDLPF